MRIDVETTAMIGIGFHEWIALEFSLKNYWRTTYKERTF
jgi:hypothetical protein